MKENYVPRTEKEKEAERKLWKEKGELARQRGTDVHKLIEEYIKFGIIPEKNYPYYKYLV